MAFSSILDNIYFLKKFGICTLCMQLAPLLSYDGLFPLRGYA